MTEQAPNHEQGSPTARGVQILDRARPDYDPGHCWRLASQA
jgi:hypothetical protein